MTIDSKFAAFIFAAGLCLIPAGCGTLLGFGGFLLGCGISCVLVSVAHVTGW